MSENGGRGRWLSPAEVVNYGLADAVEDGATTETTTTEVPQGAKRGVVALLRALGIGGNDTPDVADDVNYIPHDAVDSVPDVSTVAFNEGQGGAKRTKLREMEDPDLREKPRDERQRAYDSDAKSMRIR